MIGICKGLLDLVTTMKNKRTRKQEKILLVLFHDTCDYIKIKENNIS